MDIDENVNLKVKIDNISMHPYVITCKYTGANGQEYQFKSKSLLYNPSALIKENRLKVYVDLEKPNQYYVDTSEILPDSAILHKFKFDRTSHGEQLRREGQYIEAVTCGVELVGRIKVNSIVKPVFLKITSAIAEEYEIPTDEKNRIFMGYVVLCRYDAPDGRIHIFASRGRWGEPKSEYRGQRVRVYYSGENFKNYHVALEELTV